MEKLNSYSFVFFGEVNVIWGKINRLRILLLLDGRISFGFELFIVYMGCGI